MKRLSGVLVFAVAAFARQSLPDMLVYTNSNLILWAGFFHEDWSL